MKPLRMSTSNLEVESDPYEVAETIALIALAPRAKSRGELFAHLKKRGISDDVANAVLYRLHERGYVNDAEFARAWSESRQRAKRLSKRVIASELREKGVASEIIENTLAEINDNDEFENALHFAERKLKASSRLEPEVIYRRVHSALARKGFSLDLISRVLRELEISPR
jgi:regulatory protein